MKRLIKKVLNFKLMITSEYQNIKIFFQKTFFQVDLKKILLSKKLKMLCHGHILLVIFTKVKTLFERFMKKLQKKSKSLELKT